MQTITLPSFTIGTPPQTVTTVEIIKQCINNPTKEGFNVDEMRNRIRVLDALEKLPVDAEKLILEDSEFTTLATAVNKMNWSIVDKNILKFAEQFQNKTLTDSKPSK